MQIEPNSDGKGITLHLNSMERHILLELPYRLETFLHLPDHATNVANRLFPRTYSEDEVEADYRKYAVEEIQNKKLADLQHAREDLSALSHGATEEDSFSEQELVLCDAGIARWIGFLNDMRLMLGTELGIEEDSDFQQMSQEMPDHEAVNLEIYGVLTWLQGHLVEFF